jgi:hypothetical protein
LKDEIKKKYQSKKIAKGKQNTNKKNEDRIW